MIMVAYFESYICLHLIVLPQLCPTVRKQALRNRLEILQVYIVGHLGNMEPDKPWLTETMQMHRHSTQIQMTTN